MKTEIRHKVTEEDTRKREQFTLQLYLKIDDSGVVNVCQKNLHQIKEPNYTLSSTKFDPSKNY